MVYKADCGVGIAAPHQATIPAEKKPESEAIAQCHTTVKSEAASGQSAAKKLVGNTQQVNPELLRYVVNTEQIYRNWIWKMLLFLCFMFTDSVFHLADNLII